MQNFRMKLFSNDPVNRGRQPEADIGKAICLAFLPFIHITIECSADEALASGFPYLMDTVIGGPLAAPMFLICMGISLHYSRSTAPSHIIRRGWKLFFWGFLLNLCRYVIPYMFAYAVTGDYDSYLSPLVYFFFDNDILQCAGMALLFIGIFKKWKLKPFIIFMIGIVMNILSQFVNGIDFHSVPLNIFFGYFIGTEDAAGRVLSDFPICCWFMVISFGYLFGDLLLHLTDKKRFYRMITPVCTAFSLLYFYIGITHRSGMFGDGENCYYHISLPDAVCAIAVTTALLGIYYFISRISPKPFLAFTQWMSRHLTTAYCIHWVILIWITNIGFDLFRGTRLLDNKGIILTSSITLVLSLVLAEIWAAKIKPALLKLKKA